MGELVQGQAQVFRQRMREYMKEKNLSAGRLAQALEMGRVTVNQYVTESKSKSDKIPVSFVMDVLAYDKNLSAEWLLRGEGAMFKGEVITSDEEELCRLRTELIVKEGIIKELRSIILDKKDMKREQLVG